MNTLKNTFGRLSKDESGQSLIEYSLIASIIAIGTMWALYSLQGEIRNIFNTVTVALQNL